MMKLASRGRCETPPDRQSRIETAGPVASPLRRRQVCWTCPSRAVLAPSEPPVKAEQKFQPYATAEAAMDRSGTA